MKTRLRATQRHLPRRFRTSPAASTGGRIAIGSSILLTLLIAGLLAIVGGVGIGVFGSYNALAESLKPRLAQVATSDNFETTRIFDRNGALLYEFFDVGRRTSIPYADISPLLIDATVAVEDQSFFENTGVDYPGIARTIYANVSSGAEQGGASTITQQLIKAIVLTDEERSYENRYQRKMTEIILAQELSQQYTKEEILELYLNEIYYGNLAYGIEAAANTYFDQPARELTLPQAALLAGLPQLPTRYDPFAHLESGVLRGVQMDSNWLTDLTAGARAPLPKRRQITVLRRMVEDGYITAEEGRRAIADDLRFSTRAIPLNAPHFVFYVRQLLEEQYGPEFAGQGLSIYTTIDLRMQEVAQQHATERIQELEARNIHNAAVVVMQPGTGQILAMVGSVDYNGVKTTTTPGEDGNVLDGQVNVAVSLRQPGSALKPFTFLAAMERGATPATVFWDVPTRFPVGNGTWYEPQNYNGRWNGPVRMRTALANSLNMPAIKALKFAGIDQTLGLLQRAGINSLNQGADFYGLSMTLGGGEVTPIELTAAYNTLASNGNYFAPTAILRITDRSGEVIEEFAPARRPPALNPDHVAIISDILSDDTARIPVWGLNSKLKLSRPAAVKTGTSNDWRDAWAVGYTPYLTVGVWTGNNNNEPTARVESLTGGGVIWHNVMEAIFADPRFATLLAEPFGGTLPTTFARPTWLTAQPMCALPGRYNLASTDIFSPEMLASRVLTLVPDPLQTAVPPADGRQSEGCDLFTTVQLGRTTQIISSTDALTPTENFARGYCTPDPLYPLPADQLATVRVWNFPPAERDTEIEYRWNSDDGSAFEPSRLTGLPQCAAFVIPTAVPIPTEIPGDRMPDLRGFGENQAREWLATLGITSVYVDYQTRDRIPDSFDRTPPYAVVSSIPAPGQPITPQTQVVLGVRAPDDAGGLPNQPGPLPAGELPTATPEYAPTPSP